MSAAVLFAGCATRPDRRADPAALTYGLAVTVTDGSYPTPAQWSMIHASFRRELAAFGWTLVDDLTVADRILRIEYTPNSEDPALGRAVVLNISPNPVYGHGSLAGPGRTWGNEPIRRTYRAP